LAAVYAGGGDGPAGHDVRDEGAYLVDVGLAEALLEPEDVVVHDPFWPEYGRRGVAVVAAHDSGLVAGYLGAHVVAVEHPTHRVYGADGSVGEAHGHGGDVGLAGRCEVGGRADG